MYYIYRITNKINGKTYIGQHKYKKLNDYYMGSGILLAKAKKKYGIKNFEKEILEFDISNVDLANDWEQMYIMFERAKGKAEYNIANGGLGNHFPKEIRDKIRKSRKAHDAMLTPEERKKIYGRECTDEARRKMSESHKGKKLSEETRAKMKGRTAWNKGKKLPPHTEDWKEYMRNKFKNRVFSEETKKKISEAKRGKHWKLVDGKRVYY